MFHTSATCVPWERTPCLHTGLPNQGHRGAMLAAQHQLQTPKCARSAKICRSFCTHLAVHINRSISTRSQLRRDPPARAHTIFQLSTRPLSLPLPHPHTINKCITMPFLPLLPNTLAFPLLHATSPVHFHQTPCHQRPTPPTPNASRCAPGPHLRHPQPPRAQLHQHHPRVPATCRTLRHEPLEPPPHRLQAPRLRA